MNRSSVLDTYRERSNRLRSETEQKVERARSNDRLTADARRGDVARVYMSARQQAGQMREQMHAELSQRRDNLESRLYGATATTSADVLAMRDALDRAGNCNSKAAASALLRQAVASGDAQLATAVARTAVDRDWGGVFREWLGTQPPGSTNLVDQLADIDTYFESPNKADPFLFNVSRPVEFSDDVAAHEAATQTAGVEA